MEQNWQDQLDFTRRVLQQTRGLELGSIYGKDLTSITEKYLLSMHKELDEVLDGVDWKEHRNEQGLQVRDNVIGELIDVQKFLWGLMQIWGVTPEEFSSAFQAKTFVVNERFRTEHAVLGDKIAVVDIDGVLFDYDESFRLWLDQARPFMKGASKQSNAIAWEEAKWEYRESHRKRYGEANVANVTALKAMKAAGWTIVLMTYRPKKVFQALEYDTLYWLQHNEVPFDRLIWAAYEKYFYMRDEMRMADIFIDDEFETCQMVAALGKRVYWMQNDVLCGSVPANLVPVVSIQEVYEQEQSYAGS